MKTALDTSPVLAHFDRDACLDLERALATEWLETDGVGGFASSTILCCPTRRYHAWLVAVPPGNAKRHVFLSRFQEVVIVGGEGFPISVARYPGVFAPLGHQAIESFALVPWPRAVYRIGAALVTRELLLVRESPTLLVRYRIEGSGEPCELDLRPLLACREADALTVENDEANAAAVVLEGGIACRPYAALPAVSITWGKAKIAFEADPTWYKNVEYSEERRRGYPFHEDHLNPGVLRVPLAEGKEVVIAVTIGDPVKNPALAWKRESARRADLLESLLRKKDRIGGRLALAADDFLFRTAQERLTVCAGYPWFGEWGRDTFVALPGLTLARGRVEECAEVLSGALAFLKEGLLPNTYGLSKEDSRYDSVDASLWFARAVRLFDLATKERDKRVVSTYLPALEAIGTAYFDGTSLGIRCDEGGLIVAGGPGLNPTWMDAQTPEGPVTARDGCAVEIAALWIALLAQLVDLYERSGNETHARKWEARRKLARSTFLARFWLEKPRYLADVWKNGVQDARVRPNMLIAAALEASPLSKEQRADVVRRAEVELLTPRGLRTLAPRDAGYRGLYGGGVLSRDRAYHQGTVWPWLLGFYCEAFLRAHGAKKEHRQRLASLWDDFASELDRAGLNHVSEVFDGDVPHRPGGTIAQAWNTAEWLRARAML